MARAEDGCPGDCDGSGSVAINELVRAVAITLGEVSVTECPAADADGDGRVTIDELVRAVRASLNGCPPFPTPSPSETATETPTHSATPSASATPTEEALLTPSPTITETATMTPTATASRTATAMRTTTATRTRTVTPSRTRTPTVTPSKTRTPSATLAPTAIPTDLPTQTATPSPTAVPTATVTTTLSATVTPTAVGLGTRRFSINGQTSLFITVVVGQEIPAAGFEGYLDLTAHTPDGEGHALIDVTGASEYISLNLGPAGVICIRPIVPASAVGLVACLGGLDVGVRTAQDHHIGEVGVGGFTEADCAAAGGTVETDVHPGVCNGPIEVAPSGEPDSGPGGVLIGPVPDLGLQGLPAELTIQGGLPCGGGDPGGVQPLGFITGLSRTEIVDADAAAGALLSYEQRGENFSCESWAQENGPGKLVLSAPTLHGAGGLDLISAFVLDD